VAVDGPNIVQRYLAIVERVRLVEYRGDNGCNEIRLIESDSRAELMVPKVVIRIGLEILLPLVQRAENDRVPNGNGGAIHRDTGTSEWSYRVEGQNA
jgi:hypothetical protein